MRDELAFLWAFPLAIGMAFPQFGAHFAPFADKGKGSTFLYALWAVQGVTLTLSMTVVIFVFQSVYATRIGGSLQRFAEETGLFLMFYIGLAGLFLDGVVLLGGGHGASGGWAATWAASWAGIQGLSLLYLFVSTIRAIDPSALHGRRIRHARLEIKRATERVILRRLALAYLRDFAARQRVEYVPVFASAPSATVDTIEAGRVGELRDVRLRLLRRFALRASKQALPQPRLRAQLGESVRENTALLWAEPAALNWQRRWTFRIRRRDREQGFLTTIQELHSEAIQAIQDLSPTAYAEITEIYEQMLLALPETWATYGAAFGPAVAGEATPFELGFLDYLERYLYLETELATTGASREIAQEALNFPIRIASRALSYRAISLTDRMLRLWAAGVNLLLRPDLDPSQRGLIEWSQLRISEYGRLYVQPLLSDDERDQGTREFARDALVQVIEAVAAVCKSLLDRDPSKTQLIGEFNGILDDFIQHWQPEYDAPTQWDVEAAENAGVDAAQLNQMRLRLEENRHKTFLRDEINDSRAVNRFGLLFWILRHVRDGSDGDWTSAWPVFAAYFSDVDRLARITELAVEADFADRGRWSNWVLDTLPKNQAHGIAVDLEFVQTFIVRALSVISPDGPDPQIDPMDWVRGRLDDPEKTVREIAAQERLAPLLPDDRLDDRVEMLIRSLKVANARRQELEDLKVIEADLDAAKADDFERVFRESFWTARWVRAAITASDAFEAVLGAPPNEDHGSFVNGWLPKGMFIEEATIAGIDMSANDYARKLSDHENSALIPELQQCPVTPPAADEQLAQTVRRAVRELKEAGHTPALILMPYNWLLYAALEPQLSEARGGDAPVPGWFTGDSRSIYLGLVDGVPVCQLHRLDDEQMYVVDLTHFVKWREWTRGGDGLLYELKTFNLHEAEALVDADADGGNLGVQIERTRKAVRFRGWVRHEQAILDAEAGRVVGIPANLRRG